MLLVLLLGCRKVEPAPEDLDGLLHFVWDSFEAGADAGLLDAGENLLAAAPEDLRGSMSALSAGQTVALRGDADPAEASGLFLVYRFDCVLPVLEPLLYATDQDELYPGAYDAYDRGYTSDLAAFQAREATHLSWEIALTASTAGATFHEWLTGGLRYVPSDGERGALLVQRTFMPRPAEFESGSRTFDQDWQIEAYLEESPGRVAHLYGIWRSVDYGAGLTDEHDGVKNLILDNLEDWDDQTEVLCAGGRP